jgi:hypothetical protein
MIQIDQDLESKLQLPSEAIAGLKIISLWTTLISWVGAILCAGALLFGIFALLMMPRDGFLVFFFILLGTIVVAFLLFQLFRFSSMMRLFAKTGEPSQLVFAIRALKNFSMASGILAILAFLAGFGGLILAIFIAVTWKGIL